MKEIKVYLFGEAKKQLPPFDCVSHGHCFFPFCSASNFHIYIVRRLTHVAPRYNNYRLTHVAPRYNNYRLTHVTWHFIMHVANRPSCASPNHVASYPSCVTLYIYHVARHKVHYTRHTLRHTLSRRVLTQVKLSTPSPPTPPAPRI